MSSAGINSSIHLYWITLSRGVISLVMALIVVVLIYQQYKIHNLNRKINSKSEAIVVIDAEKNLKELTLNLVRENIGKEELKLRTQESLKKMEVAVSAFKNQGLVILDKKCLIAGALDVTEDIRMVMSRNNINSVTDGKVILKKQN